MKSKGSKLSLIHEQIVDVMKQFPDDILGDQIRQELEKR